MLESLTDASAQSLGMLILAAWGAVAFIVGLAVAVNFHGAAEFGAKMARFGRQPSGQAVRSYRLLATCFTVGGALVCSSR
jgi:hypothetical protein